MKDREDAAADVAEELCWLEKLKTTRGARIVCSYWTILGQSVG